jgi:NitT/TauT family transport system ATP-binding protein
LLRVLAGLLPPSAGTVEFIGNGGSPAAHTSLVFQEDSLFPWMTVLENAAFGLEMQKVSKPRREARAMELLARFGLAGRERAYPRQLSNGMKQRIAVVRAFLSGAPVLLMDEPFGALDCQSRMKAQLELLDLWRQDRKTVIFVTHDVGEAILLSDRILVLSACPGTVIAEYAVRYERPRSMFLDSERGALDLKRRIYASLGLSSDSVPTEMVAAGLEE